MPYTMFSLKGKYHANLLSFQNPKNIFSVSRNKEIIVKFVLNYHPSAMKLSISASGMDSNLKNFRLMFFKFSHFCFQNALEQITSYSFQELS